MREVTIVRRLNGYQVTVGCQTIVLEGGPSRLCEELFKYLSNPAQVEEEWLLKYSPQRKERVEKSVAVNRLDAKRLGDPNTGEGRGVPLGYQDLG